MNEPVSNTVQASVSVSQPPNQPGPALLPPKQGDLKLVYKNIFITLIILLQFN